MLQRIAFAVCALVLAAGAVQAQSGQGGASRVSAALEPEHECRRSPRLARGEFKAVIDEERGTIDYELTFSDLQADSRQSHIHIGQPVGQRRHRGVALSDDVQPGPAGHVGRHADLPDESGHGHRHHSPGKHHHGGDAGLCDR